MHLKSLTLTNFKNYAGSQLRFSPKLNFFVGQNGAGKTNLLDAIYYLSFCKSYFHASDRYNIRHEADFLRLDARFELREEEERIVVKMGKGKKKEISRNDLVYARFSEHIGVLPVIMIAPDDVFLIKGPSEDRRKIINATISQLDQSYLQVLIRYNKLLQQRNATLKQFQEQRRFDANLLNTYDSQMAPLGTQIFEQRKQFIAELNPLLQHYYATISEGKEEVACQYRSGLHEHKFADILAAKQQHDRLLQRTTEGPHRDDLIFTIRGLPLKKYGSQGQQKSYLLALKLALYQLIKTKVQVSPILLLDDLFDKLDAHRVEQLVALITSEAFGQVFISDTHLERMTHIFDKFVKNYQVLVIENGTVQSN